MTKKVSDCAQVAKLLKQKGKELGLTLSAKSISYAGRNSVTVDVLTGIDKAIKDLKDYSEQFEYSKWNGVYELNNYNENILGKARDPDLANRVWGLQLRCFKLPAQNKLR